MSALYDIAPNAVIRTALATYRGVEGFQDNFGATYYTNAGSPMAPQAYGELEHNAP